MEITAKTPWIKNLGDVPAHLEYFQGSMFEAVEKIADEYPNNIAFDFMGRSTTYREMVTNIEKCARSLRTIGVREGDKVTIAMPNCPQAIYMFYAVNLAGAVANMVHPLSSEKELEFYINESESVTVVTLDQFYHKIEAIRQNTCAVNIVIARIKDALSRPMKAGYMLTEGRKIKKIPADAPVIMWDEFMHLGKACFWNYRVKRGANDRRQDALRDAAVPRLRPRRVHPLDALAGRPLHPCPALHRAELFQAHHQVPLQLHRRRPDAVRGAAASAQHG